MPTIAAQWKYTAYIREFGDAYDVMCLKRCYSLMEGKRVTPDNCGMEEWEEEQWWTSDPMECNQSEGFKTKFWMEDLQPYLREWKNYKEDHIDDLIIFLENSVDK